MKKAKVTDPQKNLILIHYALSNSLSLLINQASLKHDVKNYCKLALKVMGVILADLKYDTGTQLLMEKEFDPFFARFPAKYYNKRKENRKLICLYTVAINIESCIETNEIVYSPEDKTENTLI